MTNFEAEALRAEVKALGDKVDKIEQSVVDLVDAWRLAGGLLKAVKYIAAVATALAAIATQLHFGHKGDH
jgi:phage shock protein A